MFSLLFCFSLAAIRETGGEVVVFINKISQILFNIVETIIKLAPIGASSDVYHRQIRCYVPGAAGEFNGVLLSHLFAVYFCGIGSHRQIYRF